MRTGNDLSVDSSRLLCEPLDERVAIGHLATGLGQWFARLGGHDVGQVFGVLLEEFEPVLRGDVVFIG